MIFAHTLGKVLDGTKTQTRRIVKPGQMISAAGTCVYQHHPYRIIYEVGGTYAVQPARAAKGIARIRITSIRCEDVRDISQKDVIAEGFEWHTSFWLVWTEIHDKPAFKVSRRDDGATSFRALLATRPAERYQAWVLTFELVKP